MLSMTRKQPQKNPPDPALWTVEPLPSDFVVVQLVETIFRLSRRIAELEGRNFHEPEVSIH
jgi:hypothetical protein